VRREIAGVLSVAFPLVLLREKGKNGGRRALKNALHPASEMDLAR
jgi:hypothetical protein